MAQRFEVKMLSYAYGGDCLGRLPDGRAVFVPFSIPGETVEIELVEDKRSYARARLVRVLEPSPLRVQPLCIHFGECGGCAYQHMPYEEQLLAKTEIVRDQLRRIAGIEQPPVQPIVPSPEPYYYRNTIQFHLNEEGRLGFIRHDGRGVLPIQECHLPQPALNAVWPLLEMDPVEDLERIGLRQGQDEDTLLWLESQNPQPPDFELDIPISAVHLSPAGSILLAGDDYVVMEVHGRPFRVSAGSFFQVNTRQAEAMVNHLLDRLPLNAQTSLYDVYCGVGLFSAFLAPKAGYCTAIESSPAAVDDFAFNLEEFDHIELYQGRAEEVLPGLERPADVVVVDPPRAGLERAALDAIVAKAPAMLAYVSCDLATLARDIKRLVAGGYRLDSVQPFDMFPQTAHMETVVLMSRVELVSPNG